MDLDVGLPTPPVGTALSIGCAGSEIRSEVVGRAVDCPWPPPPSTLPLASRVPWFVDANPRP